MKPSEQTGNPNPMGTKLSSPTASTYPNQPWRGKTGNRKWRSPRKASVRSSFCFLRGTLRVILVVGLLLVGVQVFLVGMKVLYFRPFLSLEVLVSQSQLIPKESFMVQSNRSNHHGNYSHLVPTVDELSFNDEVSDRIKLSHSAQKRIARAKSSRVDALAVNELIAQADPDLQPILRILRQGGYDITNETEFNTETMSKLPKWSTILDAYGTPRVLGLETCEEYQKLIPFNRRNIGVAGTFNSGTNLLAALIDTNCRMELGTYKRFFWQVPWGKHYPASHRQSHTYARKSRKDPPPYHTSLPVVTVRDPYTWMQSMCRRPYAARFLHDQQRCPNLIPYPEDKMAQPRLGQMKYVPVNIGYSKSHHIRHESLAHMWNNWYGQYVFDHTYPKLIVRMEDVVFHAETILPPICECIGAKFSGSLLHEQDATNPQKDGIDQHAQSSLLNTIIKYGNIPNRRKGYPKIQLEAAREILANGTLMEIFRYPYEEVTIAV